MKRHFNIPIFIPHLGCPFDCIFCNQKKIAATLKAPGLPEIKTIIEEHLRTLPAASEVELAFFGGTFTAIDKDEQIKYLELIQPYLKSGKIASIRLSTRPDFINNSILGLLKEYGVKTIELGVQSLDDGVLKKSGRGYKVEDVFRAAHLIKEHNFMLGLQLMVGLPGDNYSLDIKSTWAAISLVPDMVRIYPTLVIKETFLAKLYADGKYQPLDLTQAVTITKEMYLRFMAHNIKVIRMGLHPSEELSSGDALIAGPFHPAFGELVMQEVFYDMVQYLLGQFQETIKLGNELTIYINPKDFSKMLGNRKNNIAKLKNSLQIDDIKINGTENMALNSVGISTSGDIPSHILQREDYLKNFSKI